MLRGVIICVVLSLFGICSFACPAQEPERPTIEQFMKIRAPGSPTLVADGTLYVTDWPDGVAQLYRRAAGDGIDGPWERLTDFEDGLSEYSLARDDRLIMLAAAAGGSEQDDLHLMTVATGEIRTLLADPEVVYNFNVWLPDNSGFIYTANDEEPSNFHVYRYDLKTGSSTKLLAREGWWGVDDITNDGKRMLVSRYYAANHAEVYELNARAGELTRLAMGDDQSFDWGFNYMPDEQSVLIVSDREGGIPRLFVLDIRSGRAFKPFPALDRYEAEGVLVNDDRTLGAALYNVDGFSSLKLVRLPGFEDAGVSIGQGSVAGSVSLRGDTLTWTLNNPQSPGTGYAQSANGATEPVKLTKPYDQGVDLDAFPLPKLVKYESFDGLEIPALLFLPPGYEEGRAIPFVAWYHGGPEGQSRPSWSPLTQYLLSRGFGIIKPNVRGSSGYGREYLDLDNYQKRWDSVRDGVAAAEWLVAEGLAEPGRIAAFGGSYGGFMAVATIMDAPELFGASCNFVGIVNFKTFLQNTKAYRRKLREVEYGPLSDPEFLDSISPIHRIDEIKVPMLIAHGLNDPRVPVGESMQLAVGLQKRGFDPDLLYFPDEGHGFVKLENRILFADRVCRFLQEHIGGGS